MFENSKIICSTPQCIANDVKRINFLENVSLCVLMRHIGLLAITVMCLFQRIIQKQLKSTCCCPDSLARLGKGEDSEDCGQSFHQNIEVRTHKDEDVREYVKEINVEYVPVDLPKEFNEIILLFKAVSGRKSCRIAQNGRFTHR